MKIPQKLPMDVVTRPGLICGDGRGLVLEGEQLQYCKIGGRGPGWGMGMG